MAILLTFLLLHTVGSGGITLELTEKIPVHFDWAEGMQRMAYADGKAYFSSGSDYNLYVFDLERRELATKLGGEGNGPGEFPSVIHSVSAAKDQIMVQTALWIHFFDLNGRFIHRVTSREPSFTRVASLSEDKHLIGVVRFRGAENLEDMTFIGVLNALDGTVSKTPAFGRSNTSNNIFLSNYVFVAAAGWVVVAVWHQ